MTHTFFSQSDFKRTLKAVAEERGVPREALEKLAEDLRRNVVVPLQTIDKNRPTENSAKALKEVSTLFNVVKMVLTPEIAEIAEIAEKAEKAEKIAANHTAAPAA
jgi:hypothetical protein